jgi:hypothetical protein
LFFLKPEKKKGEPGKKIPVAIGKNWEVLSNALFPLQFEGRKGSKIH